MTSLLAELSAPQLRKAAVIKDKIDKLQKELGRLLDPSRNLRSNRVSDAQEPERTRGRRRRMSAAARAKIAAAARARWKKAKAAGKTTL